MIMKPLMPRTLTEELIRVSYEEYLEKNPQNELAKSLSSNTPEDKLLDEFNNKINYLIETVENLQTKKEEIKELWNLFFTLIKLWPPSFINSHNALFIFPLVSITGEAKLTKEEKREIIEKLEKIAKDSINALLLKDCKFSYKVEQIKVWYEYHIQYLVYLGLGVSNGEITYLKNIIENHTEELESLKSSSPHTFIDFIQSFKPYYISLNDDYKAKFRDYYKRKCLEQIIVAKNSGYYIGYEKLLEDYYSEKLKDHKKINWLFKNLIGYGEKPWRLVGVFFLTNILFSFLFTFGCFDFHFDPVPKCKIEYFFTYLYFNNTTMLTVGYGDIYPEAAGSRIMVALLQIIGFAITGSAIALFLRKLLRF